MDRIFEDFKKRWAVDMAKNAIFEGRGTAADAHLLQTYVKEQEEMGITFEALLESWGFHRQSRVRAAENVIPFKVSGR